MPDLIANLVSFFAYFIGALVYGGLFGLVYTRLTPHREFHLIVGERNATAVIAFGGSLVGYALAASAAIHNARSIAEFAVWGLVAVVTQVVAYLAARLFHHDLSDAIERNVISAGIWVAAVSIAVGLVSAACMSP